LSRLSAFGLMGGSLSSLIFVLLSVVLLLFSVLRPDAVTGVRGAATDRVVPVFAALSEPFYALADMLGNVTGMATLQAENAQLTAENVRLREWYQTALILQAENASLQELLNLKIEPQHGFVSTRVVADSGNAFAQTAIVVAGNQDGVEKGEAVLSGQGMIGRVIEADRHRRGFFCSLTLTHASRSSSKGRASARWWPARTGRCWRSRIFPPTAISKKARTS
jgi:rod shape-determining protein MreC